MLAKVIVVIAATAFVGTLSAGTEAWARGGKGGHGGGKSSGWVGKSMHGVHGKPGHHFPHQMNHAHGKHDPGHKHDHALAQGVWRKASGKSSDFRRDWQAGSSAGGGGGYGGSVGDICINSQFCQGVWYQVTKSGSRPSQSSATYQRNWQAGE
jgi:hypothetical protein